MGSCMLGWGLGQVQVLRVQTQAQVLWVQKQMQLFERSCRAGFEAGESRGGCN
jgi:hypothetical protein